MPEGDQLWITQQGSGDRFIKVDRSTIGNQTGFRANDRAKQQ
jgi:hypothetical protein